MKRIIIFFLLLNLVLQINCAYSTKTYVKEVFKWKRIEYENLPQPANSWIGPYKYHIPENNDIVGVGYHPASGLMVVNIFRCRPGVPITVGAFCVKNYKYGSSPTIWGFPNYELNTLHGSDFGVEDEEGILKRYTRRDGDVHSTAYQTVTTSTINKKPIGQNRIISAFHTAIDEKCNRLFLIDNGVLQYYLNTTYNVQKPALVEIHLPPNGCKTRNFPIKRRFELPDRISSKGSNGFMFITMDYQSEYSCNDLFLYITNPFYGYLVVFDYKKNKFWAIDHETFKPVVAESHFIIDNTYNFDLLVGLLSVALGYPDKNGDRTAYYFPFSSTAQYAVSTKFLKNSQLISAYLKPHIFNIMGYRGSGNQQSKIVIDYTYGVAFFIGTVTKSLTCWNINKSLNPDNIEVLFQSDKVFFYSEMFIDSSGYLWFHSSHAPVEFATDEPLNLEEVNSRTFRIKVSDAIRGTICEDSEQYRQADL